MGRFINQRDGGADHRAAARINHCASNAAAGALRVGKRRGQANRKNQRDQKWNAAAAQRGKSQEESPCFHELTP